MKLSQRPLRRWLAGHERIALMEAIVGHSVLNIVFALGRVMCAHVA